MNPEESVGVAMPRQIWAMLCASINPLIGTMEDIAPYCKLCELLSKEGVDIKG